MEVTRFDIEGLLLIKPNVFLDERGYFYESFSDASFSKEGLTHKFVQDNQSCSKKGVLRGLHFQNPPFDQGKLVRVVKGSVLDIAVDIRKNSPSYGKYVAALLTEENKCLLWIPPGFAHGFLSLEDDTIFIYKCTNGYNKASEGGILWNDPDLNIDWGILNPIVSGKDMELTPFRDFNSQF